MSAGAHITPEKMINVWELYRENIKPEKIANILDVSYQSVCRIINVMRTAKTEGVEATEKKHSDAGKNIREFAYNYFGLQREPKADIDNSATCLVRILEELHENNELLKQMLAVWQGD